MKLVVVAAFAIVGSACVEVPLDGDVGVTSQEAVVASEGFEAGSKTSYAAGDVTFSSGTWNLSDALVGTLASDAKSGARSVRLRNSGRATMRFDLANGVGTVTLRHASFGTDPAGRLAVDWSQDGGATWTQAGAAVTTAPGALVAATFTVNRDGAIRLQVRKLDGSSARVDVDDLVITDHGAGPGPSPDPDPTPTPGAGVSIHTRLGLPSPASTSRPRDYLSVKSQYVLSYDSQRKVPNWVSWQLDSTYLGSAPRQDNYRTDTTLPAGMAQATSADYSGSGWDRGHLCPSGDRTKTTTANSQTFYLTNMIPQASNSNGGPWADLEAYGRTLAGQGKVLYIVAGGIHTGASQTIGNGVAVPDQTFKVIVVLDSAGQGPAEVTSATRVIAVIVPNDDDEVALSDDWRGFRVAVDDIEALTGLDFLADVAPAAEAVVESRIDDR